MSDIEERPSKKARLENSDTVENSLPEAKEPLEKELSNPANEFSDDGEADHQAATQLQNENTAGLSKSQLKKLRKKQEWEAGKEYRKVKRREKHKEKQTRKAIEKADLQAKIAAGEIKVEPGTTEPKLRYKRPIQTPVSLILDCDFNELMTDKELISLGAQLTRCYSDNRCTPFRSHIAISSWGGVLQSRFETVLNGNHLGWKGVKFFADDFEAAAKEMDRVMRSKDGGKLVGAFAPPGAESCGSSKADKKSKSAPATTQEVLKTSDASVLVHSSATDSAPIEILHTTSNIETTEDDTCNKLDSKDPAIAESSIASHPIVTDAESTQDPSLGQSNGNITQPPPPASTDGPTPAPQIVYLSSDSPYTLERLSPNTSYIIGGIVDKNRHKGLCYKRACERGITTAKLPIGEYMVMQSRSVLAVNHVVEIMLKWMETGDWGEAFLSVMPKRKGAKLKNKKGKQDKGDDGSVKTEDDAEGGDDAELDRDEESDDEDVEMGGTPLSGRREGDDAVDIE